MALRSGRFNFDKATNTEQIIIKGKKNQAMFRIFNSGKTFFKINVDGADLVTLNPSYSIDIAGGNEVKIVAVGATAQGMYEYISADRQIRSGRFNTQNPRDGQAQGDALLVADMTSLGGGDKVYYRFFNSGRDSFNIYNTQNTATPPGGGANFLTLAADQSIDLQFAGNKGAIWVKSIGAGSIEGIYDFLDSDM